MGLAKPDYDNFRQFKISGKGACLGYPKLKDLNMTPEAMWQRLGVDVDYFDVQAVFGPEKFLDLNAPLPDDLVGQYDFLINPGTYEHCFNVGQAVMNGYRMVKPGGLSFHRGPLTRGKHGFWNYTAKTLKDFYGQNGGKQLKFESFNMTVLAVCQNGPDSDAKWPYEALR